MPIVREIGHIAVGVGFAHLPAERIESIRGRGEIPARRVDIW
jgi:hypothetical protein